MANVKVIGTVLNVRGDVQILDASGMARTAVVGDSIYAGESIVSNENDTFIEVKYLALEESTIYEDVFNVLVDASVYELAELGDNELDFLSEDVEVDDIETEAGEEGSESNAGAIPESEITAQSSLLELDSGLTQGVDFETNPQTIESFTRADTSANNKPDEKPIVDDEKSIVVEDKKTTAVNDENIQTNEDASIVIGASTLLSNDINAEASPLSVTKVDVTSQTHGSVRLNDDGDVVFTPQQNYFGSADFSYTIRDSAGETSTASVSLNITSDGVVENVKAKFTEYNDSAVLGAGNDNVDALAGDDYVDGGNGNNSIRGGLGSDTIITGTGNDRIYANTNKTYADAGAVDTIDAGAGNDTIYASGEDVIDGGTGYDTLDARKDGTALDATKLTSVERVYGSSGDDVVSGDRLYGYDGNDTLTAVESADDGDNRAYLYGGKGTDTLTGSDDATTKDYLYGEAGADTINAGDGNDIVYGGTEADTITGGEGNDRIYANTNKTYADAGAVDTIDAGAGNDTIYASGEDVIDGGTGYDTLDARKDGTALDATKLTSVERVYGSSGDDVVSGDRLYGYDGNDTLTAVESADDGDNRTYLYGGAGEDELIGSSGIDYLYGGADADTISGGDGVDRIYGNEGNDTLIYDSADAKIDGGADTDTLLIDSGDLNLSNVGKLANIEKIELGDNSSIIDSVEGINISDVIKITGGDTLIIQDTNDSSQTVNIDTTVFSTKTSDGSVDTYTAIDNGTTYTIEIDTTIVVD